MSLTFTSARRAEQVEPVTFTLDGETFNIAPSLAGMALLDLGAAADTDTASAAGLLALRDFLRAAMSDDDEWRRFREHTLKHRTDAETLLAIVQELMPVLVGRPTEPPSLSPDTSAKSSPTSRVVSFSRGTVDEAPVAPASSL